MCFICAIMIGIKYKSLTNQLQITTLASKHVVWFLNFDVLYCLTVSQTTNFSVFQTERVCRQIPNLMEIAESFPNDLKTLLEKEKSLVMRNFFFSHSVFKRLVQQTCKNQGLFGKGLTMSLWNKHTIFSISKKIPSTNVCFLFYICSCVILLDADLLHVLCRSCTLCFYLKLSARWSVWDIQ